MKSKRFGFIFNLMEITSFDSSFDSIFDTICLRKPLQVYQYLHAFFYGNKLHRHRRVVRGGGMVR